MKGCLDSRCLFLSYVLSSFPSMDRSSSICTIYAVGEAPISDQLSLNEIKINIKYIYNIYIIYIYVYINGGSGGFPGGPVVKTPCLDC